MDGSEGERELSSCLKLRDESERCVGYRTCIGEEEDRFSVREVAAHIIYTDMQTSRLLHHTPKPQPSGTCRHQYASRLAPATSAVRVSHTRASCRKPPSEPRTCTSCPTKKAEPGAVAVAMRSASSECVSKLGAAPGSSKSASTRRSYPCREERSVGGSAAHGAGPGWVRGAARGAPLRPPPRRPRARTSALGRSQARRARRPCAPPAPSALR